MRITQQFMDHLNLKFTNKGLPKNINVYKKKKIILRVVFQ